MTATRRLDHRHSIVIEIFKLYVFLKTALTSPVYFEQTKAIKHHLQPLKLYRSSL